MKKIVLALLMFAPSLVFAWGGRGHDTICRTAVFLLKEPGLKEYLQQKPQMMGHVCNMPDFYWKSISGEVSKAGNPTHFIDPEVTGMEVPKIPLDYKKIVDDFTGKENLFKKDGSKIFHVPTEFGSVWWRADQFMRRIGLMKNDFANAKPPTNGKDEQNADLQYNKLVYQMVVDMGLMGHFVGDTSQPFHTTADYDGYAAGHGGIHAYFEDGIVGEFDGDLETRVLTEARKFTNASFLKPSTTVEKMKALSEISMKEIPKILKLDPVLKPSVVKKEMGMELRTPAERMPTAVGYKRLNKMIVTDMARGATLLAALWDEAYASAGRPQLKAYKSYKYPFTVDFVAPDYFPASVAEPVAPAVPATPNPATAPKSK